MEFLYQCGNLESFIKYSVVNNLNFFIVLRTRFMTPEMKHVGKLAKKSGKAFGMDKATGTDKRDLFVELESLSLAEKEIDDGEDGTIFCCPF